MAAVPINQHTTVPTFINRACGTWVQHANIAGRILFGAASGAVDIYAWGTRQTRSFHIWVFDMAGVWQVDGPNTWVVRVDVSAVTNVSIERVWICKVDAFGVSLGTLGTWSGSTAGTGIKTLNVNNVAGWVPALPNQFFYVVLGGRSGAVGFPSISIRSSQLIDAWISPIVTGGGPLIDREPIGGGLIGGKLAWFAPPPPMADWVRRLAA